MESEVGNNFIHSEHYHCKKCNSKIRFLTRLSWKLDIGIRALGICDKCELILIEFEKRKTLKWIKIPNLFFYV